MTAGQPEPIELTQAILGLRPYVLLEFVPDADSETGFKLNIAAGGGLDGKDDVRSALALTLLNIIDDADETTINALGRLIGHGDEDQDDEQEPPAEVAP